MLCRKYFPSVLVLAASLCWPGLRAAETPQKDDADAKTKALEERVRTLEKRIAELEARDTPQNNAPAIRPGWKDNPDDVFEQMRREMMQNDGAFDWNNLFGQNPALRRALPGRRQMLGVGIDQVSDELKARYKNPVKEGAFVISVYPNSPAEKAGVLVGDAITSFDGKTIPDPQSLIDAVKATSKGEHEVVVSRRGESLMLKVKLNAQENAGAALEPLIQRDLRDAGPGGHTRTELHVSALELPDSLAKDLKLNDDQKKKMAEILNNHAKALSEDFEKNSKPNRRGGAFGLSTQGNLSELAKTHADSAAKDLAAVLSPGQLQQWNDYRNSHSSVSFSQSIQMNGAPGGGARLPQDDDEEKITF